MAAVIKAKLNNCHQISCGILQVTFGRTSATTASSPCQQAAIAAQKIWCCGHPTVRLHLIVDGVGCVHVCVCAPREYWAGLGNVFRLPRAMIPLFHYPGDARGQVYLPPPISVRDTSLFESGSSSSGYNGGHNNGTRKIVETLYK